MMTYRQMLQAQGYKVNESNLFILGNWIGDEGQRGQEFPDAKPMAKLGFEWEAELFEDCGEMLESEGEGLE